MNFPPDVISKAVLISDELRQKQLPEKIHSKSNIMPNNSSLNKRTTHRSTLLETTSTSEHSHFLRLFYNLYADMVSINQMTIGIEEKQELLNKKMKELAEDLPSNVLEMAKKGNLFEMFKRSPNVPLNIWTPTEQGTIEEEPLRLDDSQSFNSHDSTNFSVLSHNSIARRIGLELQGMQTGKTASRQVSNARKQTPIIQQSVQFPTNSIDEMPGSQSVFDDSFIKNRFDSGRDAVDSNFSVDDFDFMNPDVDFMDHELTQYFSNLSPKDADENIEDEPNTVDFSIPDILDKRNKLTSISDDLCEKPRSYQNTSVEGQVTSSKEYTKSKSTNMNTSQKSQSSSWLSSASSGLFRLQLKGPLKMRDNRILRTPPKNVKSIQRVQNPPLNEFTFSDQKDITEQRSISRLSFNVFNDDDFSSVEIPTIPTSSDKPSDEFSSIELPTIQLSRKDSSDSPSKSFQLNLTQFCSREANEQPFFDSTQDIFQKNRKKLFPELSQAITPIIRSTSKFRDTSAALQEGSFAFHETYSTTKPKLIQFRDTSTAIQDETFAFPEPNSTSKTKLIQFRDTSATLQDESFAFSEPTTKTKLIQYENSATVNIDINRSSQLNNVVNTTTSQEKSSNFFNLNDTSNNSARNLRSLPTFQPRSLNKVTIAPKINPSTALQFIQHAYQDQSDNDSSTDDEDIQAKLLQPMKKIGTKKLVAYSNDEDEGVSQVNIADNEKNVYRTNSGKQEIQQQKLLTDDLGALKTSLLSGANDENVENIILPVPSQFL